MDTHFTTTPFGRRSVTLGQIASQVQVGQALDAAARPGSNAPAAVNKWQVFRTLTQIRERLGVSDRSLSVLNALLSFHQETALSLPAALERADAAGDGAGQGSDFGSSCELVVFPSNKALSLRAHGMAATTLRRHLAALVDAGLIIRRDSPNGKRYARKTDGRGGKTNDPARFADAFGFDLTPLVTRAAAFDTLAEELRVKARQRAMLKERISLHRRDLNKLIALGLDEALEGPWEAFRQRFMGLVTPMRQIREEGGLEALGAQLAHLRSEVVKVLELNISSQNIAGNASHNGQHDSNSNTQYTTVLEPASSEEGVKVGAKPGDDGASSGKTSPGDPPKPDYPLALVLDACPDVSDFHFGASGIRTWPEFLAAVRAVRPMLGISPSAFEEAREVLGEADAHMVIATILQRSEHSSQARPGPSTGQGPPPMLVNGSPAIRSAGGYLRALTDRARAGEFALGPVLMALIGQRMKVKRALK